MTAQILVERHGAVARILLNRPEKRNAMRYTMWAALEQACAELIDDSATRMVVVSGAGGNFCAGADIHDLHATRAEGQRTFREVNIAAEDAMASLPLPTIAAIDGDCIGGGCALAVDCDIRLATRTARFGITPAKLGIAYPGRSMERLVDVVGHAVAKRMLFTAGLFSAEWALEHGLIDEIVDDLDAAVERWSTALTPHSLLSQAATKSMLAAIARTGSVPAELSERWNEISSASGEAVEGAAAFAERRPPQFTWHPRRDR